MFKNIHIKAYHAGLVFKDNRLINVLQEGAYWVFGDKQVHVYDMNQPFTAFANFNVLLQNEDLAALLNVVEIADGEIVLRFVNGNFNDVLVTGRYAFWKGLTRNEFIRVNLAKPEITEAIPAVLLEHVKLRPYIRKFVIANFETGLLIINGRFVRQLDAGTHYFWANATTVEVKTVDVRQLQMEIAGQELLTKDKATLRISFFVRYQVTDAVKAVTANKEFEKQLYVIMQLALRAFTGGYTLDEILGRKDTLAQEILGNSTDKISALGVTVFDAGIRDIILPGDMKEIMNQVLVAEKKAQANSIMRREETAATRSLLNTAKLMEENEMLWKLKEMEYVEKIADRIGEITVTGGSNIIGQLKEIFVK